MVLKNKVQVKVKKTYVNFILMSFFKIYNNKIRKNVDWQLPKILIRRC